jgi:hypothetical protein
VSITVNAVNDAPVITGQNTLLTNEYTPLSIALADITVEDVDNTYPTGFSLTVQSGANYTHVENTIIPNHDFHGVLSIPVKVNDGLADSNIYNLQVTVIDVLPTGVDAGRTIHGDCGSTHYINWHSGLCVSGCLHLQMGSRWQWCLR